MSFTRADFYGLNLDWYAVDAFGQVAQLNTGFSPLPRNLFEDEDIYRRVCDYFNLIKPNQAAFLSQKAKSENSLGIADYSLALKEARRGLFIYDENEYGPIHTLIAVPVPPLNVTSLPEGIQQFLNKFHLPEVNFKNTETIDFLKYFDCVQ